MRILRKIFITTLLIISINSIGQNLISSNATNEGGAIELVNPLKTADNIANKWIFYNMTGQYGNSLQFWNYGNNGFYGSRFTILDNGNVGIGTTTPGALLEVNGKAIVRSSLYVNDIRGFDGGNVTIGPNTGGASSTIFMIGGINATEAMRINYDKNVGIGTATPDEKLTVKGKIHAQEVKVDLLGPLVPDYVFANDYKLKTLQEVEAYIKQNNHLPEIPSAQEIEKNGLMLAEMNMSLLKKMEEMTLYMIELKKENEVMKDSQKKIENRLKVIEKN